MTFAPAQSAHRSTTCLVCAVYRSNRPAELGGVTELDVMMAKTLLSIPEID